MTRSRAALVAAVLALVAVGVVGGLWLRSLRDGGGADGGGRQVGASVLRNPDSTVYTAPDGILFDLDSAELNAGAVPVLEQIAADVRRSGLTGPVVVEGHTDDLGSDDYNISLSRTRAQVVAAWLVEQGGVDQARIVVAGLGEKDPVKPNDSEANRRANRRVVIAVMRDPAAATPGVTPGVTPGATPGAGTGAAPTG